MPNPRYLSREGEPSVELLSKLLRGKQVFENNLGWFCEKHSFHPKEISNVQGVYLIGSHAEEMGWKDDTSDLDFKLVVPDALPQNLLVYKREVLDPLLHQGDKKRWIDIYFAREHYQVTLPRWDITSYWQALNLPD